MEMKLLMYFLNNCKDLWPVEFSKEQESLVVLRTHLGIGHIWIRDYIVNA